MDKNETLMVQRRLFRRASLDSASIGNNWQQYAVYLWTTLSGVMLFTLFHARTFDDPYITYRYAQNLAHGDGFVYNVGERVLSTTTPLYTLVLAIFAAAGLDVPTVSASIGCAAIALGGLALWRFGNAVGSPLVGTAALGLYPTFPQLVPTLGAETAFYTTLILWGIVAYVERRYTRVAALLALATLTRADGIVATGALALHFIAVRRGPPPWRAAGLFIALTLPWFIFAAAYFGAPAPVTLAAKQHQGSMQISTSFGAGLWLQVVHYWRIPLFRIHFALAALGLVWAILRQRVWLLVVGWSVCYALAYTLLGVSNYFWYYGPLTPAVIVLIALGIDALTVASARTGLRRVKRWLPMLLVCGVSVAHAWSLNQMRQSVDGRSAIYRQTGEWLKAHTPTDASVGTLEVGVIGYYADRRMIDFAGLIQPAVAQRIKPTTTYQDTALWAVSTFRPTYLVLQGGIFPAVESDPQVVAACRQVADFHNAEYAYTLVVHECRW